MAGRANGYDEAIAKRITDALNAGNTRTAAVAYGGIDYKRFQRWMVKNASFTNAVKAAEAQAEVSNVAIIAQAARGGTWQAAAWWLERRRHEDWRRREDVNVGNQGGKPFEVKYHDPANPVPPVPAAATRSTVAGTE